MATNYFAVLALAGELSDSDSEEESERDEPKPALRAGAPELPRADEPPDPAAQPASTEEFLRRGSARRRAPRPAQVTRIEAWERFKSLVLHLRQVHEDHAIELALRGSGCSEAG